MDNEIETYKTFLKILYDYYEDVKNNMKRYFYQLNDDSLLEINFSQDFFLTDKKGVPFIEYNKKLNRFVISISSGTDEYNQLLNRAIYHHKDIFGKYEDYYYSYFSEEEISQMIQDKNLDFIDFMKSEFLYEYIKKIMSLESNRIISYQDDYGEYQENVGFSFNKILVEIQTRLFARNNHLFYLPKCIGNRAMIRICYFILQNKDTLAHLLNDSLDAVLETLPYLQRRQIQKFEIGEFEKKFGLAEGTLELSILEVITYRSPKIMRQEYINMLKIEKENIVNNYLSIDS